MMFFYFISWYLHFSALCCSHYHLSLGQQQPQRVVNNYLTVSLAWRTRSFQMRFRWEHPMSLPQLLFGLQHYVSLKLCCLLGHRESLLDINFGFASCKASHRQIQFATEVVSALQDLDRAVWREHAHLNTAFAAHCLLPQVWKCCQNVTGCCCDWKTWFAIQPSEEEPGVNLEYSICMHRSCYQLMQAAAANLCLRHVVFIQSNSWKQHGLD